MSCVSYNRDRLLRTSESVSVANDAYARLMYYLNCVASCLEGGTEAIPLRLRDHENYDRLSHRDRIDVLWWAQKVPPQVLEYLGVFVRDHTLCRRNSRNEFYKASDFRPLGTVLIHRNQCPVKSIMSFNDSWVSSFYDEPMKQINDAQLNPSRSRWGAGYCSVQ